MVMIVSRLADQVEEQNVVTMEADDTMSLFLGAFAFAAQRYGCLRLWLCALVGEQPHSAGHTYAY